MNFKKSMKRVVIVHNHIFKNAGSTIDWALHRNFGNDFVDHRDDKNMQRGADYLALYLLENPNIRALSTHHLRPPLPLLDNVSFMTIMMFRHPIERVISVYNFERNQIEAETLGARFARNHNLREYVLWRMDLDVPPTIRNFHIFRTLPHPICWQVEVGEEEIVKAKTYVDSLEMIGFVDLFDESMILFEKSLSTGFPSIDLSYKMQNVAEQHRDPLKVRIEKLREDIGDDAFNLLMERNRADLELYDYARKLFEERLRQMITLNKNLANFRKRCQSYSENQGGRRSLRAFIVK